jgi:hypothetical protein
MNTFNLNTFYSLIKNEILLQTYFQIYIIFVISYVLNFNNLFRFMQIILNALTNS